MLEIIGKHFVAISTLTAVISSVFVIAFVYSYLSVFDWSLIWLIEYGDLAKFALLAAAMLSVWASFTINQVPWIDVTKPKHWTLWLIYPIAVLVIVGTQFSGVRLMYRHKQWDDFKYNLFLVFSELFLVLLAATAPFFAKNFRDRDWQQALNFLALLFVAISLFGKTYGYYVKSSATHNVRLVAKTMTIDRCKVIMLLSHHTAVMKDGAAIIVPTSEILEIVSE